MCDWRFVFAALLRKLDPLKPTAAVDMGLVRSSAALLAPNRLVTSLLACPHSQLASVRRDSCEERPFQGDSYGHGLMARARALYSGVNPKIRW